MFELMIVAVFAAMVGLVVLRPQPAYAHCDTMEGPTAKDGRTALETGEVAHALKWVAPDAEAELRGIFERARAARTLGEPAREVADHWFLENLVRIHRAGEGASYTGLQPEGTPVDEVVAAADRSVEERDLRALVGLVPAERWEELERRFARVLERQDYAVTDVDAARDYVAAYVSFFKYAEGHDHDHEHHHAHAGH